MTYEVTCRFIFSIWVASSKNCVKSQPLLIDFIIRGLLSIVCMMCSRILSSPVSPNSHFIAFSRSLAA